MAAWHRFGQLVAHIVVAALVCTGARSDAIFPVPPPPAPEPTVRDTLPPAPKPGAPPAPVLADDLKAVPEVDFMVRPEGNTTSPVVAVIRQIRKINYANAAKTDAFMLALSENRPDLAGLPFAMGDACRTVGDRVKHFAQAAEIVRRALPGDSDSGNRSGPVSPRRTFWQWYASFCDWPDANARRNKEQAEHVTVARIAALTQILAVEPAETRLALVKYLAIVSHVEATRALARMTIFSAEDDIRTAAIAALKGRREKDYTDVLVKGLRYPWPAVARRAADAIAKLERTDLVPELVTALGAPDPRLPTTKELGGTKVTMVREMVKVNHHRNCLLCHAPEGSGTPNPNALTAEVAIQGRPLPSPVEGYGQSRPELLIRIDVTYLRPDFSAALPVKDAHPWPDSQRFDFLVRERKLTDDEAAAYREHLTPKEPGVLSPYHTAAVTALRKLTGKDTAPTAEAWRALIDTPPRH